jgi:hypothetical protein
MKGIEIKGLLSAAALALAAVPAAAQLPGPVQGGV